MRQAEGVAGAPVSFAERVGGGAAAGVVAIDPVPGEVADRARRDVGEPCGFQPERRDVAHHQPGPQAAQHLSLGGRAGRQHGGVRRGPPYRFRGVEAQAVVLDHAGIGVDHLQRERPAHREVEQPARRRRADVHRQARTPRQHRVDDLDRARGMAEPVPGDVVDERAHASETLYAPAWLAGTAAVSPRFRPRSRPPGAPPSARRRACAPGRRSCRGAAPRGCPPGRAR